MIQDWQIDELHEQIGQATMLISKLLIYPDDCKLRSVCESWIKDHASYLQDEQKGYDISELDGDKLPF
ncbi:hypothetical protein [Mucilaginibacter sp. 10I4]|uniref:hypothetical protein n=1 Tax=Mucilaginibacter sp. 10I4 TaxID=3048580 RepID=UPI002B235F91|nr:hypothetical protein [Mucilaginibacter sp. 10I4]MEB0262886.1 hypothetical protein [Mucilaginibacter sp. 10I4]